MHNKKKQAQSIMGVYERNMALFTLPMKPKDRLDEYYWVFKAQVNTIKSYGNNPVYHPSYD